MQRQRTVAVVTGASRPAGIGAAIARRLAADGIDIALATWSPYDAEQPWGSGPGVEVVLGQVRERGVRAASIEIDLSDPDAPADLLDRVEAELDRPLILINNAAVSLRDGYAHLTAEVLDQHYAVNVRGTLLLCAEFARRWTVGAGRIINMTSGQSLGPMPGELAYVATKGAIEAFSVSFADEVAELGITVNCVNPGPTDTGWIDDELRPELEARFPDGQIGIPDDVAELIAFLVSPRAGRITGQVLHAEGGFRRR